MLLPFVLMLLIAIAIVVVAVWRVLRLVVLAPVSTPFSTDRVWSVSHVAWPP